MIKNINKLLEENKKVSKENADLQRKLREAKETINSIKTGNIDAYVATDRKKLKVFTEKTADKTYRILIEKMHEGAVTLNQDGIILYSNSCFAAMVNLPLQKVIGTKIKNFIYDSSKVRFEHMLKQGWEDYVNEEALLNGKDGKTMPVLMSVNKLSLDTDFVLSIILTDITVWKKNQTELRQNAKELEQKNKEIKTANNELAFQNIENEKQAEELNIAKTDVKELGVLNTHKESVLATLSHDLRSPLTGIIGVAEHLKNSFEKLVPRKVKEMLDLLYQTSKEELSMLDSLVEWARVKFASETFSPAKIELGKYVNKVFDTLNENAVKKRLKLVNKVEENIHVFADKKMLFSIFQNIISNSIKHTRAGGKITVSAKQKEEKIIIEVKDTGVGMTKETMEKLFTPQLKTLANAREENQGAGIGLLLVKGFLEKNGGEIWVESVKGEGSSFYFTLPAHNPLSKIADTDKIKFAKSAERE